MKNLILTVCVAFGTMLAAQAQHFDASSLNGQIGIGIGSPYLASGASMTVPPIHVAVEKGINEKIGVGGLIGFSGGKYESSLLGSTYAYKYSYLLIGVRGTYHFYQTDDLDVYGGAMLGFNKASVKFESSDKTLESILGNSKTSASGLAYGAFIGGRYYVKDNLAIFGELGYNVAWISAGICMGLGK